MLRGAIDHISEDEIGGWIYSDVGPVRRRLLLAYCDGKCIGSGAVGNFRQDLLDAGLGDGVLGFRFPISKIEANRLHRVSVKLEGGDLVLVQGAHTAQSASPASLVPSREHLEWMRSRKWLTQAEFDLLKYLLHAGVYEKFLPAPVRGQPYVHVREEARAGLELVCRSSIRLVEETVTVPGDFAVCATRFSEARCPVIGLWCPDKADLTVIEGSHRAAMAGSHDGEAVHSLGPDRIVLVDSRTTCGLGSGLSQDLQVNLFGASLPDA